MSHTRIGIPATRHPAGRLPPGPTRAALLQLAHRGVTLMAGRPGRGERLLHRLCAGLANAIAELSAAEDRASSSARALDVARLRIDEQNREIDDLQREIERLQFGSGEQTVRRVVAADDLKKLLESQELTRLRPTAARSVVEG